LVFTEGYIDKTKAEQAEQFSPEDLKKLKHLAGLAEGINVHKAKEDVQEAAG
jgi:hypothetical protein